MYPAEVAHASGKNKGFRQLKWLLLNRQPIIKTERIKTSSRSVDSRICGRPDERINPLDSGRTRRNCLEELRIHELEESMIGHIEKNFFNSESWEFLPWKKFWVNLLRLQKRVYKAVRAGDMQKARSLQKLILRSQSARFLAIRQVTQLNNGKKTAGIDGKLALTFKERFELEKELRIKANDWKHKGLREIPIPKKDGTKRILKVPTISDRAWQCLAKYALEPAHEATFHARSYGFRTGRSTHDAQSHLFMNLRSYCKGT